MTEHDPSSKPAKPDREQSDRILGPKSWTALIAVVFVLGTVLLAVVGVLTAEPSLDPTVHSDAVEMTRLQQPDPNAPSRYADFVASLTAFREATGEIASEIIPSDAGDPTASKNLFFGSLLKNPPPESFAYEVNEPSMISATTSVDEILNRRLFAPVEDLLVAPNLSNSYPNGLTASGEPLPLGEWNERLHFNAREYAFTVAGCAKVLADRGRIDEAAELVARNVGLPDVFFRQITYAEQVHGGYPTAEIMAWAIDHLLAHPNLTKQALSELQTAHAQLSEFRPFKHFILSTGLMIRDDLFRSHTASGRYIASAGWDNVPRRWHERGEAEAFVHDFYGRYFTPTLKTRRSLFEQLLEPVGELDAENDVAKRRVLLIEFRAGFENAGKRYDVLYHHGNSVDRTIRNENRHRARITALGILLAMADYRLDHGDWPETVQQLVPDYLEAMPINPLTGDPFEYAHAPGEPPSLESFGFEYMFSY